VDFVERKEKYKMAMEFFMKERAVSIHDLYHIYDEEGIECYQIKSKLMSIHDYTSLMDMEGNELARVHKKILSVHATHFIEIDGKTISEVRVELFHPIHKKIDLPGLGWKIEGDFMSHNFVVVDEEGRTHVSVHRKWLSIGEGYQVSIENDCEVIPALALMVALERILTDQRASASNNTSGAAGGRSDS